MVAEVFFDVFFVQRAFLKRPIYENFMTLFVDGTSAQF